MKSTAKPPIFIFFTTGCSVFCRSRSLRIYDVYIQTYTCVSISIYIRYEHIYNTVLLFLLLSCCPLFVLLPGNSFQIVHFVRLVVKKFLESIQWFNTTQWGRIETRVILMFVGAGLKLFVAGPLFWTIMCGATCAPFCARKLIDCWILKPNCCTLEHELAGNLLEWAIGGIELAGYLTGTKHEPINATSSSTSDCTGFIRRFFVLGCGVLVRGVFLATFFFFTGVCSTSDISSSEMSGFAWISLASLQMSVGMRRHWITSPEGSLASTRGTPPVNRIRCPSLGTISQSGLPEQNRFTLFHWLSDDFFEPQQVVLRELDIRIRRRLQSVLLYNVGCCVDCLAAMELVKIQINVCLAFIFEGQAFWFRLRFACVLFRICHWGNWTSHERTIKPKCTCR